MNGGFPLKQDSFVIPMGKVRLPSSSSPTAVATGSAERFVVHEDPIAQPIRGRIRGGEGGSVRRGRRCGALDLYDSDGDADGGADENGAQRDELAPGQEGILRDIGRRQMLVVDGEGRDHEVSVGISRTLLLLYLDVSAISMSFRGSVVAMSLLVGSLPLRRLRRMER